MRYVESKYTVWEDEIRQTIVKGYKIQRKWYTLYEDGRLFVKAGFPWDGATGAIDTKDMVLPSLDHDILTELVNEGALPEEYQAMADEQFRITERTQELVVPWYRRMWTYFAVRFFQINKKSKPARKILEVH